MTSGYEPRWDIDSERGRQAEEWVGHIRKGLQSGSVEVKLDERSMDTGNIYVEYRSYNRTLGEFVDSGITTTQASVWVFVLIQKSLAICIETTMLKRMAREYYKAEKNRKKETDGSNPTMGVVIPMLDIIPWVRYATALSSQEATT